jgi:hypothetical protein
MAIHSLTGESGLATCALQLIAIRSLEAGTMTDSYALAFHVTVID